MPGKRDREVDVSDSAFWMATYEEHGSAVMAFLTSRTGRRDVAEDLLQETFVRAIRARPTIPHPSGARSYLFTTAAHLLISRYRKKTPSLFSEASEAGSRLFEQIADSTAAAPDEAADLSRFESQLHGVLATLKPAHRTAFELAILQQIPYGEIVEQTGWSLGQVKTNVHRARKQVMAELGELLAPLSER